jgi:predicted TIM-barrel fold metal-dependent hydrolase
LRLSALQLRGCGPSGVLLIVGEVSLKTTWTAAQPHGKPNFDVPLGACNSHVHVVGPLEAFPLAPGRPYSVRPAPVEELDRMLTTLGLERVVIVNTIVYGNDHEYMLAALAYLGERARGVAVIDPECPDAYLERLNAAGVRGLRILFKGAADVGRLQRLAQRARPFSWHIGVLAELPVIARHVSLFASLGVPVVIDHFGFARAEKGPWQPGFAEMLAFLKSSDSYLKLSGLHRVSDLAPDFPDVAPLAHALAEAVPDRLLWANDWPHTGANFSMSTNPETVPELPWFDIDGTREFNLFGEWFPDAALRKQILVDNPARLYGFG